MSGIELPDLQPGTWADWLGATATFMAVVVALFQNALRAFLLKPRLTVKVDASPPDCHKTSFIHTFERLQIETSCYYFRLWVMNEGRSNADDVQVYASELLARSPGGAFKRALGFLPMNLVWSHTGEIYAGRITAGMGKHCDLGYIAKKSAGPSEFVLSVEAPPNKGTHKLQPGTYQLRLLIAGGNCRPIDRVVEFSVHDYWSDDEGDMLANGVSLEILSE